MRYQTRIDRARLVLLDETWLKTNMAPLGGWVRGKRLIAHAPLWPLADDAPRYAMTW
jgi:hypothetical protein